MLQVFTVPKKMQNIFKIIFTECTFSTDTAGTNFETILFVLNVPLTI